MFPDIVAIRAITGQMMPTTMTMMVMMTSGFIVQYFLREFGTSAVAAYGVALRVEQLFLLPVFWPDLGRCCRLQRRNLQGRELPRVREALLTCWKFGLIFMAVACPTLFFAAPFLMRLFTDDPEVVRIGVSYLRVDGFVLPVYMMLFAINSFLQALKKAGLVIVDWPLSPVIPV